MAQCVSCKGEYKVLSDLQKCVLCGDDEGFSKSKPKLTRCIVCDEDFDPTTPTRRKLGGKINQCIDCYDEPVVKYLGVQAADGKSSQSTVLKFKSDADRQKYLEFWQNNSGLHRGKSCQLGSHLSSDPGVSFETVIGHVATNHKGKL